MGHTLFSCWFHPGLKGSDFLRGDLKIRTAMRLKKFPDRIWGVGGRIESTEEQMFTRAESEVGDSDDSPGICVKQLLIKQAIL